MSDERDRLVDSLLHEVAGGERPPDLREAILRRAGRRPWGSLTVGMAAAALLGIGAWIVLEPGAPPPPPSPAREILEVPLPREVQGFQGWLSGTLVSIEESSVVLDVRRASRSRSNRAADPRALEGRRVRLHLGRSSELSRQLATFRPGDDPVTADVWSERDEGLYVTRLRAGDHADPGDP